MQDLLRSWSFRFCPWSRLSHPLFLISCSVDCCAALEQEAETAIMVIPAIPKRMFLRKLISLLSNWETQTEICHGSALGAAAGLIPLILSALITKHLCSCEQHFAPVSSTLPQQPVCSPLICSTAGCVWCTMSSFLWSIFSKKRIEENAPSGWSPEPKQQGQQWVMCTERSTAMHTSLLARFIFN